MRQPFFLIFLVGMALVTAALPARGGDSAEPSTAPVLSMRVFDLKPGVKAEDFETFVRTELTDVLGKGANGMAMHIFKGDRGERKGKYILIWQFDSVATRDRYFPREGHGSGPPFQEVWQRIKGAMHKFSNYVQERESYTDYVALSK
jgi:hypothetical protein